MQVSTGNTSLKILSILKLLEQVSKVPDRRRKELMAIL